MKEILLGVYIGSGIIGLAITIFALIVLLYFLAKNNLFFTFAEEGTAKAILKFGRFHRVIMTYKGYGLDTEWTVRNKENEVDENGNIIYHEDVKDSQGNIIYHQGDLVKGKTGTTLKLRPKPWSRLGGLRWVGIPLIHSIYKYNFRWTSFEQGEEEGKLIQKIIHHEEKIDYILVQDDIYYSFVKEAETEGMVPVDLNLLLTIRIVNPYKALFRVQNWLEATQNLLKPALRGFISGKSFEDLIKKKEEVEREADEFLIESKTDDYLERDYGVRLKKVGVVLIDPAGDRGETYVAAATKGWEADKEKIRIEKLADAEVERLDRVYSKIQSYGNEGLFIRATEAIEEAGRGPSNLVIFPFGSIQSMFEGWMGKKPSEKKEEGGV